MAKLKILASQIGVSVNLPLDRIVFKVIMDYQTRGAKPETVVLHFNELFSDFMDKLGFKSQPARTSSEVEDAPYKGADADSTPAGQTNE